MQETFKSLKIQTGDPRTQRSHTAMHHLRGSFNDPSTNTNDIKPQLLESGAVQHRDFFGLSDGFKKIFGNDKKD